MAVKHEELWQRWRGGGELPARDRLVEIYLWLVRYVAGRLMVGLPSHFEQDDVEGHGCFGLLDAVNRYDMGRGVRFETFAIPWVRGACLKGIRALQWAPALRKRVLQLEEAHLHLYHRLGREPDAAELAAHLHISPDDLEQRIAETGCLSVLSLEETLLGEEGGSTLGEQLADPHALDPAEAAFVALRRDQLALAIDSLPEQERMVVALFYHEGLLAKEISQLLNLTPARISQIHGKAILRLRGKLARMKAQLVS